MRASAKSKPKNRSVTPDQQSRRAQLETDAARTATELLQERQAAELARISLAKAELRLEAVPRIEEKKPAAKKEKTAC